MVMQRRVSDFIRLHPGKTPPVSDSASNSRRAVSGKILPINEEDSDDPVLSADLLDALKTQRATEKRDNRLLLARLAEAEASARQVEQMKQEIAGLRRCLDAETARSEGLRKQLAGRELLEIKQSEEVRRLRSEVTRAQTELLDSTASRPTMSAPASISLLNDQGLPVQAQIDRQAKPRNDSMPVDMSGLEPQQCLDCQRLLKKTQAQEVVIQGQQSVNRALMDRVADWQKV